MRLRYWFRAQSFTIIRGCEWLDESWLNYILNLLAGYPELRQCPLCTPHSKQEAASLSEIRPVSSLHSALPATPWPCDLVAFLPVCMAYTPSAKECASWQVTHTHTHKHTNKSFLRKWYLSSIQKQYGLSWHRSGMLKRSADTTHSFMSILRPHTV